MQPTPDSRAASADGGRTRMYTCTPTRVRPQLHASPAGGTSENAELPWYCTLWTGTFTWSHAESTHATFHCIVHQQRVVGAGGAGAGAYASACAAISHQAHMGAHGQMHGEVKREV